MRLFVLTTILFLTGCMATTQPLEYTSPSGKPTVTLTNVSLDEAKSKVIDRCVNVGLQITEQGNTITCWNTMEGMSAAFAQVLIGNSYSTSPTQHRQIVLTQQGDDVRLVGNRMWIQTQMALGQIKQQELNSNKQLNEFNSFLFSIR